MCVGRSCVLLRSLARCDPPPSPSTSDVVCVCGVAQLREPLYVYVGEGGSFLELPSLAVVKNSLMMQQRLVIEKLLSAQADLPSRGGRSVIPGR